MDAAFSLTDGRILNGSLGWGALASPGTRRNREAMIELGQTYLAAWVDYSLDEDLPYGRFRYLPVIVNRLLS